MSGTPAVLRRAAHPRIDPHWMHLSGTLVFLGPWEQPQRVPRASGLG